MNRPARTYGFAAAGTLGSRIATTISAAGET